MNDARNAQTVAADRNRQEKLDKIGWGIALIWIGVAFLLGIGWAVGLFGLGVIIVTGQMLRRYLSLGNDWFALTMGICLGLAGFGSMLGNQWSDVPLLPIFSIVLGVIFVASAMFHRRSA